MVDTRLLTAFLALTAVAVLIQTGILIGFYFLSTKLSRQAEQALDISSKLIDPAHQTAERLRTATNRVAEFSAKAHGQLHRIEDWWKRRES
jgi:hypothetical protein